MKNTALDNNAKAEFPQSRGTSFLRFDLQPQDTVRRVWIFISMAQCCRDAVKTQW
jgi:hypothetical protein